MKRILSEEMLDVLQRGLKAHGVGEEVSQITAEILVQNSLDGIYSHGVNRYPRVISYLEKGYIKPENKPERVASFGALEQWDGNLGMGTSNAQICMERAVSLAREHGIGCVALRNTNHWMRGGTYGLQAADAGCVGICWTNTQPNMPAWGAKDRRIGNNPLVFCLPRTGGEHLLVDAAMAQYSYGAIEAARMAGQKLPVPGGYDIAGNLTNDPGEIEKTWRVLPIGFWKGSGFSLALDLAAACLSGGNTTQQVGQLGDDEYALSQTFIAMDLSRICVDSEVLINETLSHIKDSQRIDSEVPILYPGEKEMKTRKDNMAHGIPVHESLWEKILVIAKGG